VKRFNGLEISPRSSEYVACDDVKEAKIAGHPAVSSGRPVVSSGRPVVSCGHPAMSCGRPAASSGHPAVSCGFQTDRRTEHTYHAGFFVVSVGSA